MKQAPQGHVPGSRIEDAWRFLRSRPLLLQQAGSLADDETLVALRKDLYRARKRPEVGKLSRKMFHWDRGGQK